MEWMKKWMDFIFFGFFKHPTVVNNAQDAVSNFFYWLNFTKK
jgi:hypothetical protein